MSCLRPAHSIDLVHIGGYSAERCRVLGPDENGAEPIGPGRWGRRGCRREKTNGVRIFGLTQCIHGSRGRRGGWAIRIAATMPWNTKHRSSKKTPLVTSPGFPSMYAHRVWGRVGFRRAGRESILRKAYAHGFVLGSREAVQQVFNRCGLEPIVEEIHETFHLRVAGRIRRFSLYRQFFLTGGVRRLKMNHGPAEKPSRKANAKHPFFPGDAGQDIGSVGSKCRRDTKNVVERGDGIGASDQISWNPR